MNVTRALRAMILATLPAALLLFSPARTFAQNDAMIFRLAPQTCRTCPIEIRAEGAIGPTSAADFRAVMNTVNAAHVTVSLASPGGSLIGGMQLGAAFRDSNATVAIKNNTRCVSACVYALLGGTVRRAEPNARIGVHRFRAEAPDAPGDAIPPVLARHALDQLARYAERMGADPGLIDLAAGVAPDTVRYLIPAELRDFRIVSPDRGQ
jgi:hypothetical protein